MMALWSLLKAKALIWKNGLFRMTNRQRMGTLAFLALIAYFAFFVFRGMVSVFRALEGAAPQASQALLTSSMSGLVAFAFFWGIGIMLSQLYLASDLELLLASPIPPLGIYLLKLLEGLQSMALPALLALASLIAYGVATSASWLYFVVVLFGYLCLLVLVAATSMTLIMIIVHLIPARRAQELYALIWTIAAGLLWALWMVFSNRGDAGDLLRRIGEGGPLMEAGRYLSWSPAGWLAQIAVSWRGAEWRAAALYLGLLIVGAVAITSIGYAVYQRAFYVGWAQLRELAPRRRQSRDMAHQGLLASLVRALPQQVRAIVIKDWTILPRDLRQLSGLVFPIVMGIVYVYMTATGETAKQLPGSATWMAMAIVPLIPFFLTLYYTVGAIGLEGSNFALLRAVPLPAADLLWGKFVASLGPTLLIGEVTALLVGLLTGASMAQIALLLLAMIWFSVGFVAIAIGTSLLNPNFQATTARRSVGVATMYATMGLSAAFWVVNLALVVWLVIRFSTQPFAAILRQLVVLAFPDLQPYLQSALLPLAIIGVQVLLWGIIVYLWRRGINWIEHWDVTALG